MVGFASGALVAALIGFRVVAAASSAPSEVALYQATRQPEVIQYLASQSATYAGDYFVAKGSSGHHDNVWIVQFSGDVTSQDDALRRLFRYPENLQVLPVRYSFHTLTALARLVLMQKARLAERGVRLTYVAPEAPRDAVVVQGSGDPATAAAFMGHEFPGQPLDLQIAAMGGDANAFGPDRLGKVASGPADGLALLFACVGGASVGLIWCLRRLRKTRRRDVPRGG